MCDYGFECLSSCCSKTQLVCTHFKECVQECNVNKDCSTECCSFGFCSATSKCSSGRKLEDDYCDVNTECASGRCKTNYCSVQEPVFNSEAVIGISVIVSASLITIVLYCCLCRGKTKSYSTSINH